MRRLTQLLTRLKEWSHARRMYAGKLMISDLQRLEQIITYLLWAVVTLASGLVWHAVSTSPSHGGRSAEPVQKLQVPAPHKRSGVRLLAQQSPPMDGQRLPSLFNHHHAFGLISPPAKSEALDVLVPEIAEVKKRAPKAQTEASKLKRLPLAAISVRRLSSQDGSALPALNIGQQQLRLGHFDAAKYMFEQVLEQDAHQVIALAGMLVVMSQRGDIEQREIYLARLRQEIPEYVPNDDLFLLTGED